MAWLGIVDGAVQRPLGEFCGSCDSFLVKLRLGLGPVMWASSIFGLYLGLVRSWRFDMVQEEIFLMHWLKMASPT